MHPWPPCHTATRPPQGLQWGPGVPRGQQHHQHVAPLGPHHPQPLGTPPHTCLYCTKHSPHHPALGAPLPSPELPSPARTPCLLVPAAPWNLHPPQCSQHPWPYGISQCSQYSKFSLDTPVPPAPSATEAAPVLPVLQVLCSHPQPSQCSQYHSPHGIPVHPVLPTPLATWTTAALPVLPTIPLHPAFPVLPVPQIPQPGPEYHPTSVTP